MFANNLIISLFLFSCACAQDTTLYIRYHGFTITSKDTVFERTLNDTLDIIPTFKGQIVDTIFYRPVFTPQDTTIAQYPDTSGQTWQEMLEDSFDIVETFDYLQDWKGEGYPSFWDHYSYYGADNDRYWIQGNQQVWGDSGKSLCLDYGGNEGCSRLGFHIGDSPDDGYDDMYVFFMNRYDKEFYPMVSETNFGYWGFFKTFELATGFRDVDNWGTVEEQARADQSDQVQHAYGLNVLIINYGGGSHGDIYAGYNFFCSNAQGTNYNFESSASNWTEVHFANLILNGEWFGIEYHFKKSDPHGSETGLTEMWLYSQTGEILMYDLNDNIVNMRDATDPPYHFNHNYNKILWGGNRDDYIQKGFLRGKIFTVDTLNNTLTAKEHKRKTGDWLKIFVENGNYPEPLQSQGYYVIALNDSIIQLATSYQNAQNEIEIDLTSEGTGDKYISCISKLYVDDIIVDDKRIGIKYFEMRQQ